MPNAAVCIPIRNEAGELPSLFEALEQLTRPEASTIHICLMLDGCTDSSGTLAEAYRDRSSYRVHVGRAPMSPPNAGKARHRAMMLGSAVLAGDEDGLLLTTDADSQPATDWLTSMVAALTRADVVTGRVVRNGSQPNTLQDRIEAYLDALFALRRQLDPVPWEAGQTHHFTGGANMGVRASAYGDLGGFAPLISGEDARFVDDAGRLGLRVRRDAACLVSTSARRHGRCPGGLADALQHLDATHARAVMIAHPGDEAWQFRRHASARLGFAAGRLDLVARELGCRFSHVMGVARDCANAEAFAMRIVPTPPHGMRSVALPLAETELAALSLCQVAA